MTFLSLLLADLHGHSDVQELGRRLGVPDLEPMQMPAVRPTGRRLPESLAAQISGAGGRGLPHDDEELQLPDGINVEEAR